MSATALVLRATDLTPSLPTLSLSSKSPESSRGDRKTMWLGEHIKGTLKPGAGREQKTGMAFRREWLTSEFLRENMKQVNEITVASQNRKQPVHRHRAERECEVSGKGTRFGRAGVKHEREEAASHEEPYVSYWGFPL